MLAMVMAVGITSISAGCTDGGDKEFVVATNTPFSPFEYVDGNMYYGVDIEIAKMYAEANNLKLVIKDMDFDAIIENVNNGYSDIAMAGLTYSEKRAQSVNFTNTYFDASQVLVVPASDTTFDSCTTAEEVEAILGALTSSTKIGVQNGTTGQLYVEGNEDWEFDGFAVECKGYDSAALAARDMLNGGVSYVVVDKAPAKAIADGLNKTTTQVKVIDIELTSEQYAFAVGKDNSALLTSFNAFLAEIKSNGKFQEIIDKYFSNIGTKDGVAVVA